MAKLSVVIPVFNEQGSLPELYERLKAVVGKLDVASFEFLFVDDGSTDASADVIRGLAENDSAVRLIGLSRNFGHEAASTCGLDHADGDAVVLIDADLQDPPEVIAEMLARWRDGAAVVYGQRRSRPGESATKRLTAHVFYRLINRVSEIAIPLDTGDFRLMDRRVVEVVRRCRENPRFLRGLVSWAGFRQEAVGYDRDERFAGETKYRVRDLVKLSLVAVSAFSLLPLRVAGGLGFLVVVFSLAFTAYLAVDRLVGPTAMSYRGDALLTCSVFFLAGVQLVVLSVVLHYVGLIFHHTRNRPLYVVGADTRPGAA